MRADSRGRERLGSQTVLAAWRRREAVRPPMSAVSEQPASHSEASPHVNNLYGQNI
jgi:hypothetical protein